MKSVKSVFVVSMLLSMPGNVFAGSALSRMKSEGEDCCVAIVGTARELRHTPEMLRNLRTSLAASAVIAQQAQQASERANRAVHTVSEAVEHAVQGVSNAVQRSAGNARRVVNRNLQRVDNVIGNATHTANSSINSARSSVRRVENSINNMRNTVEDAVDMAGQVVRSGVEQLAPVVQDMVHTAAPRINGLLDELRRIAQEAEPFQLNSLIEQLTPRLEALLAELQRMASYVGQEQVSALVQQVQQILRGIEGGVQAHNQQQAEAINLGANFFGGDFGTIMDRLAGAHNTTGVEALNPAAFAALRAQERQRIAEQDARELERARSQASSQEQEICLICRDAQDVDGRFECCNSLVHQDCYVRMVNAGSRQCPHCRRDNAVVACIDDRVQGNTHAVAGQDDQNNTDADIASLRSELRQRHQAAVNARRPASNDDEDLYS